MKILIVEDLPDSRYLLEQLLRAHGYEVSSAADGVEALEKLGAAPFDAVIADIMMPRMDGFELCYNVRSDPRLQRIPFIFYTATYTLEEDRAFALSLGADAFIVKPEEPKALVQHLREILRTAGNTKRNTIAARFNQNQFAFIKEYNARLVRKLQDKIDEARQANEQLNQLNRTLEQRVAEKTRELERSNRELESFAQTLSHDLQAPLRAIEGFINILNDEVREKLSPESQSYFTRITAAAVRMSRMIDDVMAYSLAVGGCAVQSAAVDVDALVREVAQLNRALRGRVEIAAPLQPVLAHETSLRQVISNLLANAVKFVRPGVEPRVIVRSEDFGNRHRRLWIEDNGIGIEPAHQTKIFGLYERLRPEYEGNGVGLAIVAKAMERMGGRVGVQSRPGEGSRFWLELPRP
jgi:signal transduction histidine kinase